MSDLITVYSIARLLATGQIDEITGALTVRARRKIVRGQSRGEYMQVCMDSTTTFTDRREAIEAGRSMILREIKRLKQKARDLA